MMKLLIFSITILVSPGLAQQQYPYACDSPVYCLPGTMDQPSLLHIVQMAKLYPDSKTFVDKPMKYPEAQVLESFNQLMQNFGPHPDRDKVRQFVDDNFSQEGTEFEQWEPSDWHPDPRFLDNIQDPDYKEFARAIHARWDILGRKINQSIANSEQTSLIYLDRPFIVPGGRFREMYYWDSYWTILGLLQSEMYDTVHGMLENFIHLIRLLGFIPNGTRIYYNRRSQPPLFISMVEEYYKATDNITFVREHITDMENEFQHWLVNRTRRVTKGDTSYNLARYHVLVDGPRPESYVEDYRDGLNFGSPDEKKEFYANMKSGAESGWDYSTKWFVGSDGEFSTKLTDNKAKDIIPVELNSYLCRNSRVLSEFYRKVGQTQKADYYNTIYQDFIEAIDKVLWDEEKGVWFDYDLIHGQNRKFFYPSNIAPLWADCYPPSKLKTKVSAVVKYLEENKAWDYAGGVPTSNTHSCQQWDFPNGWPPLQELIVTGLDNTGDPEAQALALELVKKWVKNNYVSYIQSNNTIFEKYDVTEIGLPGGGGEYDVQKGFGWTNGVLLSFFSKYGDRISTRDSSGVNVAAGSGLVLMCLLATLARAWTL